MSGLSDATPANSNAMPTASLEPAVEPVVEPTVPVTEPVQEPAAEPTVKPAESEDTGLELPEVKEDEKADGDYERSFEDTGNDYINTALETMERGGVDLEKAFGKVFETDDPNDIDLEYLNSVLGEAAAFGLVEGLKAENSKMETAATEETTRVHEAVEGKDNWDSIIEWIKTGTSNLTTEGRDAYNAMLQQGGVQATLAAQELYKMFKQSPGFIQKPDLISGDAVGTPGSLEPISRAAYSAEYDKIARSEGAHSPALTVLDKRREFTMAKGM